MWFSGTSFWRVDIHIVDFTTDVALILVIDLHYFDFFFTVGDQLLLVLGHKFWFDAELTHLLRFLHPNNHVIEVKVWFSLDSFESLEDVTVLFSVKIQRMLGRVFRLQLGNYVQPDLPT